MSGEPIWVHPKGEEAPGQNTEPKQIRDYFAPRKEKSRMENFMKGRKKGRKKGGRHKGR